MKALPILEIHEADSFKQMIQRLWQLVVRIINGRISFGDGLNQENIDGQWQKDVVSPGVPNTDFTMTHNLGRVPVGCIVMFQDAPGDIYIGSVAPSTTTLTLRCTVATVKFQFFIV